MKKLAILCIIVAAGVGCTLFYSNYKANQTIHPEYFLPGNTVIYLNQKKFSRTLADFRETPLAANLAEIDFVKLSLDLDLSFSTVTRIRELQNFIRSSPAKHLFQELLADEFSLALLPDAAENELLPFMKQNTVLFSKPKHLRSLKVITNLLAENKSQIKATQYGRHIIYRIRWTDEIDIVFVEAEKMIVATFDERTIRRLLDLYDNGSPGLGENFFYQNLRKEHQNAETFLLFDFAKLKNYSLKLLDGREGFAKELRNHLEGLRGFTMGAVAVQAKKHFTQNSIKLHFNSNVLRRQTAHFLKIPPQKDLLVSSIPDDTFFYYWTNTFDLRNLWDIFAEESREDELLLDEFKNGLERMTNISFTELLNLPENTIHVLLRNASTMDLVPLPNFSFVLTLHDPDKTRLAVDTFLTAANIPHRSDYYRGVEYTYWGEEIQQGLQPVYAIRDGYLYISSSVKMQTDIIDAIGKGPSIVNNISFKKSGAELLNQNNTSLYIQMDDFLEVMQQFIHWSATMIAIQNRQTARKSMILNENLLIPFLDGLKMYESVASTGISRNGAISWRSNIVRKKIERPVE